MSREETCCFTGHRRLPAGAAGVLAGRLDRTVDGLISSGILNFIAGGALGFDTLAAQAVLRAKDRDPRVRLILAIPCADQNSNWSPRQREVYDSIRLRADVVRILSQKYYPGCMHLRNRYMADRASVCVCYLTKNSGGAFGTFDPLSE